MFRTRMRWGRVCVRPQQGQWQPLMFLLSASRIGRLKRPRGRLPDRVAQSRYAPFMSLHFANGLRQTVWHTGRSRCRSLPAHAHCPSSCLHCMFKLLPLDRLVQPEGLLCAVSFLQPAGLNQPSLTQVRLVSPIMTMLSYMHLSQV